MSVALLVTLCLLAFAAVRATTGDEDLVLFEQYRQGDASAFNQLMRRHQRGVVSFIYRQTGDVERARELAQDVFLRVIRNASTWTPNARFTTWLYTIARNICVDEARRARHRQSSSLDEALHDDDDQGASRVERIVDVDADSPPMVPVRDEFRARLQGLLEQLPDEQREVFCLRHFEDLRFTEIAEIQQVSENTVKSRMRYALQSLRAALSDYDGFSFDGAEGADTQRHTQARHV